MLFVRNSSLRGTHEWLFCTIGCEVPSQAPPCAIPVGMLKYVSFLPKCSREAYNSPLLLRPMMVDSIVTLSPSLKV